MVIKDGVNRMGCKYKQYEQSEPIVCKATWKPWLLGTDCPY